MAPLGENLFRELTNALERAADAALWARRRLEGLERQRRFLIWPAHPNNKKKSSVRRRKAPQMRGFFLLVGRNSFRLLCSSEYKFRPTRSPAYFCFQAPLASWNYQPGLALLIQRSVNVLRMSG